MKFSSKDVPVCPQVDVQVYRSVISWSIGVLSIFDFNVCACNTFTIISILSFIQTFTDSSLVQLCLACLACIIIRSLNSVPSTLPVPPPKKAT